MPADAGTIIQIVESSGGSLSIISCLYMGYRIRNEGVANTANRMLSFLFVVDFILGIAYVIGRAAIPIHGLCQFQVDTPLTNFTHMYFASYCLFGVL